MSGGIICIVLAGYIFVKREQIIETCKKDEAFAIKLSVMGVAAVICAALNYTMGGFQLWAKNIAPENQVGNMDKDVIMKMAYQLTVSWDHALIVAR